ncbi:MAG: PAS domain S-box protein [Bacteroidales bacterium]|nr:PAS domain S-box protein [Bacteroidales bacterium]
MKNGKMSAEDALLLRQKAEKMLEDKTKAKAIRIRKARKLSLNEGDIQKLLHELDVHQIELEMQNDELQKARNASKKSSDKYAEVYEFAHTGYFTLSKEGVISELNLTGAKMLGLERANLVGKNFIQYVTLDTKFIFREFINQVFDSKIKEKNEIRLIVKSDQAKSVLLEGIVSEDEQKCLITVIDVTKNKRTEQILKLKTEEINLFDKLVESNEKQIDELKKEINFLSDKLGENGSSTF